MSELTGRLLVVDDNEANRDMLSRRLERKGHSVLTAEGGEQALASVAAESFDVVLLDVMMPGIDGYEVLRRLRGEYSPSQLPVIMATARDQREDIVQALKLGANDYVTKPLDFPVVLARVQTQLSLRRAHQELAAANEHMRKDLAAAAKVQQALLPTESPDVSGLRFAWKYQPCAELAGDIFNVFRLTERHFGLYVLDVSGHGVPAALLAVTLSKMLAPVAGQSSMVRRRLGETLDFEPSPPAGVAGELNRRFQLVDGAEQYFTLFYGVLDVQEFNLKYVVAGHPGPVYIPADGEPARLEQRSFPIGWVPDVDYPEQVLHLNAGDRLFLYSDGIAEAMNGEKVLFGKERLTQALVDGRGSLLEESVELLVQSAADWSATDFDDDVSVLALEMTAE